MQSRKSIACRPLLQKIYAKKKHNNIETWDARVPTLYIFPHWRYSHSLYIQHAVHYHIKPIPAGANLQNLFFAKSSSFLKNVCKTKNAHKMLKYTFLKSP